MFDVDPRIVFGSGPKDRLCQLCTVRMAEHDHHAEFKKMGGRKGAAKKMIERPENHKYICSICHDAIHLRHSVASDGFCCDICPQLRDCYYGSVLLNRKEIPEKIW